MLWMTWVSGPAQRGVLGPECHYLLGPPTHTWLPHPGKSALHWAAAVNNVDAAVVLLKNGANKDMQNNKVSRVGRWHSPLQLRDPFPGCGVWVFLDSPALQEQMLELSAGSVLSSPSFLRPELTAHLWA